MWFGSTKARSTTGVPGLKGMNGSGLSEIEKLNTTDFFSELPQATDPYNKNGP